MADTNTRGATKAKATKCIACGKKWKGNQTICDDCRCKKCRRLDMLCDCENRKRGE